jgi:hypothetical protein
MLIANSGQRFSGNEHSAAGDCKRFCPVAARDRLEPILCTVSRYALKEPTPDSLDIGLHRGVIDRPRVPEDLRGHVLAESSFLCEATRGRILLRQQRQCQETKSDPGGHLPKHDVDSGQRVSGD